MQVPHAERWQKISTYPDIDALTAACQRIGSPYARLDWKRESILSRGQNHAVRIDQPLARATEHLERAMLAYAMKQTGGRLEEAAALLGLSRKGLYLKRQRLGLE